jgi:TatD DNase family protein
MFSDTHFHLHYLADGGEDCGQILSTLAERNCGFALDIGTKCDDFPVRFSIAENAIGQRCKTHDDAQKADIIRAFLHFSLGIWPMPEAIRMRDAQVAELRVQFAAALDGTVKNRVCALGECGLDHHWNPSGADNRNADDFTASLIQGEGELFEMQLELARTLTLPVIVHTRDAFDGTLSCIKNIGYDRGVIHCFSYGIDEARAFLDRGWYISFSGSITYIKKSQLDMTKKLLSYIPRERLLLETDAPYLAPVPFRGKVNTPVLVEYVYRAAADLLEIDANELSRLVDDNAKQLFTPNPGENIKIHQKKV